jgi:hypothetical protein
MPLRNQLAHLELSDGESSRFGEAERVGAKTETSFRLNCNNKKSTLPIELGEWREYMFTKGGSKSFFFLERLAPEGFIPYLRHWPSRAARVTSSGRRKQEGTTTAGAGVPSLKATRGG